MVFLSQHSQQTKRASQAVTQNLSLSSIVMKNEHFFEEFIAGEFQTKSQPRVSKVSSGAGGDCAFLFKSSFLVSLGQGKILSCYAALYGGAFFFFKLL